MRSTTLIAKVIGPVLIIRAASIVIDREHFLAMLRGLDAEVGTVAFSMVPIFLLMACIALAVTQSDRTSLAGMMVQLIAWAGMLKTSALILFPHAVAAKAQLLGRAGFLNFVLAACFLVGGYFTWFGYFAAAGEPEGRV